MYRKHSANLPFQRLHHLSGHLPGTLHLFGLCLAAIDGLFAGMPHGKQGLDSDGRCAALEEQCAHVGIVHLGGLEAKAGGEPGLQGLEKFVVEAVWVIALK